MDCGSRNPRFLRFVRLRDIPTGMYANREFPRIVGLRRSFTHFHTTGNFVVASCHLVVSSSPLAALRNWSAECIASPRDENFCPLLRRD